MPRLKIKPTPARCLWCHVTVDHSVNSNFHVACEARYNKVVKALHAAVPGLDGEHFMAIESLLDRDTSAILVVTRGNRSEYIDQSPSSPMSLLREFHDSWELCEGETIRLFSVSLDQNLSEVITL